MDIITKSKNEFKKMVSCFPSDPFGLLVHVAEVEKWAHYLLKKYSQADKEILLLSAWLHDLGHYPVPTEIDHAIRGEQRAREFLTKENYPQEKMEKVLHCVRAHRCKDVMPEILEAKLLAFADSASHMTGGMYFDIAHDDKEAGQPFRAYSKMERDFRDLASFPEIQAELSELREVWEKLVKAYEKINLE